MVLMAQAGARPYRGVKAADRQAQRRARLLDAGLSVLGSDSGAEPLTVRGVCRRAGLSARYFYESFTDRDDFVGAVYDWVIADLATTTQAAVAAAPPREQARAGMANIVRSIAGDMRVSRLLFSAELADPVVVRKRDESSTLLATLLAQHVSYTSTGTFGCATCVAGIIIGYPTLFRALRREPGAIKHVLSFDDCA